MKNILKAIFDNVFWPAAAGNVFWSFCNLVIDPTPGVLDVAPRLVVLIFFSIYLTVSWLRLRVTQGNLTYWGWFFDFLHIVALVFASLSAQVKPDWLEYFLVAFFVVTAVGHLSGQWKLPEDDDGLYLRLAAINSVGILVILAGKYFGLPDAIRLPGSFVFVFGLWVFLGRWKEIAGIDVKLRDQGS